jgi:hypothetical protein
LTRIRRENAPHHNSRGLMTVVHGFDFFGWLFFNRYVKAAKQVARMKQS